MLPLVVLILILPALALGTGIVDGNAFKLPTSFLGTWLGKPSYNPIGPYDAPHYLFSISLSPLGDYLMEVNLVYDSHRVTGYQRFYIEGYGDTAGVLWYCGSFSNFSNS